MLSLGRFGASVWAAPYSPHELRSLVMRRGPLYHGPTGEAGMTTIFRSIDAARSLGSKPRKCVTYAKPEAGGPRLTCSAS